MPLPSLPSFLRTRVAAAACDRRVDAAGGRRGRRLVAGGSDDDETGTAETAAGRHARGHVEPDTDTDARLRRRRPTPIDFALAPLAAPAPTPPRSRSTPRWRSGCRNAGDPSRVRAPPPRRDRAPTGRSAVGSGPSSAARAGSIAGVLGRLRPGDEVVAALAPPPRRCAGDRTPHGSGAQPSTASARAVVVKIDNVPAARPQSAINDADIVVEELVEGGMTRLAAVFHSNRPAAIGPVRSARSTDIGIAASYRQPVFANSGANNIFASLVARAPVVDRGNQVFGGYWRVGGRPAPHDLFTSSDTLLGSVDDPEGAAARAVHLPGRRRRVPIPTPCGRRGSGSCTARGRARASSTAGTRALGGWRRFNDGVAHTDSDGRPVAPENVIVWFVPYLDTGLTDKWGEVLYEGVSVGPR